MTIKHYKMFIISIQLHVPASIRILLYFTVICLFILYSTMHNRMYDIKINLFFESLLCGAAESKGWPALACNHYTHVLLWSLQNDSIGACSTNGDILLELVPRMETFLLSAEQGWRFNVMLSVHLAIFLVGNQLDAPCLVMVGSKLPTITRYGHQYGLTVTRSCVNTILSLLMMST
jgi:hypothetical protein